MSLGYRAKVSFRNMKFDLISHHNQLYHHFCAMLTFNLMSWEGWLKVGHWMNMNVSLISAHTWTSINLYFVTLTPSLAQPIIGWAKNGHDTHIQLWFWEDIDVNFTQSDWDRSTLFLWAHLSHEQHILWRFLQSIYAKLCGLISARLCLLQSGMQ